MSDNSQAIVAALAEAKQRVQQLEAQLAESNAKGGGAAKQAPAAPGHMQRMADSMGQSAAQGQAFVDQDRFMQGGQRERIQAELRNRLLKFAMPGASQMQVDMARRGQAPPPVTPGRAASWQDAQQAPAWNDPWQYNG
jgi:murein L,D-transpeptidase YcbB/YkuD